MRFDAVCAGIALFFALAGLFRGLVRQVCGLAGFAGGLAVARLAATPLGAAVAPLARLPPSLAAAACAVALFLCAEVLAAAAGAALHSRLSTFTGTVDKVGGFGLGLAKGVLVGWVLASLFGLLHRRAPEIERSLPALSRLELSRSRAIAFAAEASALGI